MFFNQYPYINENDLNLDYILKHLKEFMTLVEGLEEWRVKHEKEYNELKKLYNDILAGNFPPSMIRSLYEWTIKHTQEIIGEAIKAVFFGLENGYFVAYIPDGWEEIIFGTTGLDDFPSGFDFGHLTLTY